MNILCIFMNSSSFQGDQYSLNKTNDNGNSAPLSLLYNNHHGGQRIVNFELISAHHTQNLTIYHAEANVTQPYESERGRSLGILRMKL